MAHIIVADDDEIVQELARRVLLEAGHSVGAVSDGKAALDAIWAKCPDLVVLDCSMPVLSGILALRQIRQSTDFYRLPVVMLTARSSNEDENVAMASGANDYVRKPFDPDELAFRVDDVLQKEARAGARDGLGKSGGARALRQQWNYSS